MSSENQHLAAWTGGIFAANGQTAAVSKLGAVERAGHMQAGASLCVGYSRSGQWRCLYEIATIIEDIGRSV
jgi:hypothetical protein